MLHFSKMEDMDNMTNFPRNLVDSLLLAVFKSRLGISKTDVRAQTKVLGQMHKLFVKSLACVMQAVALD